MKIIRNLTIVALVLFAACLVWDASRSAVYRRLSARIRVGDDKARARSILGPPKVLSGPSGSGLGALLLGFPPEAWFYGGWLEWSNPLRSEHPWLASPVRLRFSIFEPKPGEVAIFFDSSGKVSHIETR